VNRTGERVLHLLRTYQPEMFEEEEQDDVYG
jgi:hypothetical protein